MSAMTTRGVSVVPTDWERQYSIGLGALAMADMAGKRPPRARGPMMSALILSPFDFVESLISYQEERADKFFELK